MKTLLRKFPLHTFLFVPFLVFFLYAQNLGEVKLQMVLRTLIGGLAATTVVFYAMRLYLKESLKTGIFVTLGLIAFFNYGIIYEWLEKLYYSGGWPFHHIHRFLILFFLAMSIISLLFIKRIRRDLGTLNFFLNNLVGLLLLYNIGLVAFKALPARVNMRPVPAALSGVRVNKHLPDIYYIVLDGYANEHVLRKYYNFDNSGFTGFLKEKSFYVA